MTAREGHRTSHPKHPVITERKKKALRAKLHEQGTRNMLCLRYDDSSYFEILGHKYNRDETDKYPNS